MKLLAEGMGAAEITWFRFLGSVILILPVVVWRFGWSGFRPARVKMQILRGCTMAGATMAFVAGARTVDYADAIAILYAYPFLLALQAMWFLGEPMSRAGWVSIVGGFAGVLLVMRPDFAGVNIGALYIFLCALVVSIQMILNRKLGAYSHPLMTSFWGAIAATGILMPVSAAAWRSVSYPEMWLVAVMMISGAVSQILIVYAFSRTRASTLAPFTYFEIVAAVVIGYALFGTIPGPVSWAGILLILASGLWMARSLARPDGPRRQPKI